MKRAALFGGVLAIISANEAISEDMLNWCVNAYPTRVDWCKKQYSGSIQNTPSDQTIVPLPPVVQTLPSTAAKQFTQFDALLPRISNRPSNHVPTFKVGPNGQFNGKASEISKAIKSALGYAEIEFDDDYYSCNALKNIKDRGSYFHCSLNEKNSDFTVSIFQQIGGKTTDRAVVTSSFDSNEGKTKTIFVFSIAVDVLSRMLDPDLSDDQRASVFDKIGETYFLSGRKSGEAVGVQAKYTLTEDAGDLNLVITPLVPDGQKSLASRSANPVLTLAAALDRHDLIKPDPSEAPEVKAEVLKRHEQIVVLLREMDAFRYNPRFHAVGFMEGQPYNSWLKKLGTIQRFEHDSAFKAAMDLYSIAMEYMHSEGRDTDDSIRSRADVTEFLDKKR